MSLHLYTGHAIQISACNGDGFQCMITRQLFLQEMIHNYAYYRTMTFVNYSGNMVQLYQFLLRINAQLPPKTYRPTFHFHIQFCIFIFLGGTPEQKTFPSDYQIL